MIAKISDPRFSFDPETRIYHLDNGTIPSVTEVMKSVGIIDTAWFTEDAAWRGNCIHFACQLDDEGDLDESSLSPEIGGYLGAKRRLYREIGGFTPTHIEVPMFYEDDSGLVFGGRADRFGYIDGSLEKPFIVLDFKSGSIARWVCIQLAAYSMFFPDCFRRIAAELRSDGTYNLQEFPIFERRRDVGIFRSAFAVDSWKRRKS